MRSPRISTRSAPSRAEIGIHPFTRGPLSSGWWWGASLVAAAAALCLSSCRGREHPGPDRAIDPAVATIAAERAGDGFNSGNLGVPPPDLRQEVATRGEALVAKVVREGSASIGKSPLCPPYGRLLDDADRQLIVAYLRESLKASGEPTPAGK